MSNDFKLKQEDLEEALEANNIRHCLTLRMKHDLHNRAMDCKNKSGNSTMSYNEFLCTLIEVAVSSMEGMIEERGLSD